MKYVLFVSPFLIASLAFIFLLYQNVMNMNVISEVVGVFFLGIS